MWASWEVSASVSQIYLPSSLGSSCPDVRVLYHIIIDYFKLCSAIHLSLVEEGDFLLDIVKIAEEISNEIGIVKKIIKNKNEDTRLHDIRIKRLK